PAHAHRSPPTLHADPIVTKSLAPHYVVATVLLIATLFWALWDESFGQRPWKRFQREWKGRYTDFLKTAHSNSSNSQREVETNTEYQALKQAYDSANQSAAPRARELNEKLRDLSARILAVQNVFTDRRAYVSALTYDIETSTSSKESKQRTLGRYKEQETTVEFPGGNKQNYKYDDLERVYNELKEERTRLSAELGEVIKPVNEHKEKLDAYLADHMVDLTSSQLAGLE